MTAAYFRFGTLVLTILVWHANSRGQEATAQVIAAEFAKLPDSIVVDVGELKSGEPHRRTLHLKNATTEALRLTELTAGCGCVEATCENESAGPGGLFKIELTLRPNVQARKFGQPIRIRFDASTVHEVTININAAVVGDIDVNPATIAFSQPGQEISVSVRSRVPSVRLVKCEMTRGVLSVKSVKPDPSNEMVLAVGSNITSGQASELLRVWFLKNGTERMTEVPIAVAGQQNMRFLPSELWLPSDCSSATVKLLFTGEFVPKGVGHIRCIPIGQKGDPIDMPDSGLVIELSHRTSRMYELTVKSCAAPRSLATVRVECDGHVFLCPVTYGE